MYTYKKIISVSQKSRLYKVLFNRLKVNSIYLFKYCFVYVQNLFFFIYMDSFMLFFSREEEVHPGLVIKL